MTRARLLVAAVGMLAGAMLWLGLVAASSTAAGTTPAAPKPCSRGQTNPPAWKITVPSGRIDYFNPPGIYWVCDDGAWDGPFKAAGPLETCPQSGCRPLG